MGLKIALQAKDGLERQHGGARNEGSEFIEPHLGAKTNGHKEEKWSALGAVDGINLKLSLLANWCLNSGKVPL
jgi:hypothetical protein